MTFGPAIDTSWDMRADAGLNRNGGGRDPDRYSATLRRYHRLLWSKQLPNGGQFVLTDAVPGAYLRCRSSIPDFTVTSDSIIHTMGSFHTTAGLVAQVAPGDLEEFRHVGYSIGGMIVFPGEVIDGKPTINGARGMHPRIRDRFDLTLECIRRHYLAELPNPLGDVLERYGWFLRLFTDFRGYVEHFLLQDLVSDDCSAVRFFTAFNGFETSPLPQTLDAYQGYRQRNLEFVTARNGRIAEYSERANWKASS